MLNVHGVHDVRQMDMNTAKAGETLRSDIHILIRSIWNKQELPQQ
jgi:hypothetical protein